MLRGEDILAAYAEHVGGSSCMTYSDANEYLRLYSDNPKFCGLSVATVKKGNRTHTARALYWNAFKVAGSRGDVTACTYGDRIYYQSSESRLALRDWQHDNCDYRYDGDGDLPKLVVPFFKVPSDWPYCDSFRYISPTEKYMSTHAYKNTYYAESTEGYLCGYTDEEDGEECYSCENYYNHNNMTEINGCMYYEDCRDEYFSRCQRCRDFVGNDDSVEVSRWAVGWGSSEPAQCIDPYCQSCYDYLCQNGAIDECTKCGISTLAEYLTNSICINCVQLRVIVALPNTTEATGLPF